MTLRTYYRVTADIYLYYEFCSCFRIGTIISQPLHIITIAYAYLGMINIDLNKGIVRNDGSVKKIKSFTLCYIRRK